MHLKLDYPGETLSLVGRHIRILGTAFHSSGAPVSVTAEIGGRKETMIWGLPNIDAFDGSEASYMSGFMKVVDLGPQAKEKQFEIVLRFACEGETEELRRTVSVVINKSAPRPTLLAAGTHPDFRVLGDAFLAFMISQGLNTSSRALEIGPGAGRMSVAVARHLTKGGLTAFDVDASAVEFCTHNISKRYPWAEFRRLDIVNGVYNPTGAQAAGKGVLDVKSSTFDFAYCWSVFTHLVQEDFKVYLREFARVLRPGKKAIFSVFVHGPNTARNFVPMGHGFWTTNIDRPEAAIAVEADILSRMVRDAGFKRVEILRLATEQGALSGQDVVIAVR